MTSEQNERNLPTGNGLNEKEANETGKTGSHPVGVGVGVAAGAVAAGAMVGRVAGPIGAAVGAVVGGIAGGWVGQVAAEKINPSEEAKFWQENYPTRPYYNKERTFDDFRSAYQAGWESYNGTTWEQQAPIAEKKWESIGRWENEGGAPMMTWEEAKQAARDAHDRIAERDTN